MKMENPFKRKSAEDLKRENEELKKELAEKREYAKIHEENMRLKAEKAQLAKQSGGMQFDPEGFMGGVDALLGNDTPSKKKKRGSLW